MSGAKVLFDRLVKHKVKHVFGYPGGAILPVLNQFYNQDKIQYIMVRTEAGGGFMAEGYAKASKTQGVVMVTSGPGALNLTTSLQNALSDGNAILALTGQVSTAVLGTDAFQEANVIGITQSCTKWNTILMDGAKIESTIDTAFSHMKHARYGPVLLDLPKNIMSMECPKQIPATQIVEKEEKKEVDCTVSYDEIHSLLLHARRPLVLAGQGIFQSDSVDLFREFVHTFQLPVTTTLLGLGCMNETDERSLKMLGMHGSFCANMAIQNCDLLLNFGSRFDDRIIGDPTKFAPKAKIVHIDILKKNINKTIPTKLYRNECCSEALSNLVQYSYDVDPYHTYSWWTQLHSWKKTKFTYPKQSVALQGRHVLAKLNTLIHANKTHSYTIVSDVGAHQMWAAQFLDYDAPRVKFVTSGGLGTMGFALPASIGVKLGAPHDRVICICGDGGFQMTFQELLTAIDNHIHIKVIILNNSYQLMVKIWQEKFYNNQTIGTKMKNPPFELVCRALGCESLRIDSAEGLDLTLDYFLNYEGGPIVLNVITDQNESVLPMVSPGKALDDMILEEDGSTKAFQGDAPC